MPELVILDLGLPDMDGLAVLKQLHKGKTPQLVLVLTARNTTEDKVSVEGKKTDLTRREFMLLKALMENPGHVLSRDKLESSLYGWDEELASNSIEVHVQNLRKKLTPGFIKTVRGIGYTVQGT